MKRTSVFSLITLLGTLTACQALTYSPNQNQPSAYPSAGMIPYSYDAIDSRTEADVTARRESRQIGHALVSPDGSQVIYQERLDREVDLRDFSRNPARLTGSKPGSGTRMPRASLSAGSCWKTPIRPASVLIPGITGSGLTNRALYILAAEGQAKRRIKLSSPAKADNWAKNLNF